MKRARWCGWGLGLSLAAASAAPLQLALTVEVGSARYRIATAVAAELFKRAGLSYRVLNLPATRAEIMLQQGRLDGDLLRGPVFAQSVPAALRVEPPYYSFDFAVYVADPAIRIASWNDLLRQPFAYRRGLRSVEHATADARQRYPVDSEQACLAMVEQQHVAACVTNEDVVPDPHGAQNGKLRRAALLHGSDVYLYLMPPQRALAARLSAILRRMQDSGELARLTRQAGRR